MVQLVQQCLSVNRKFKNPVVAQSMRLNISAGLQYMLEPFTGSNASEETCLLVRTGQAGKAQKLPSSMTMYRLPAEGVAQIISRLKI